MSVISGRPQRQHVTAWLA